MRAPWKVPCPACEGTGELHEAVQAWDEPGAPVPECPYCEDGVLDLASLLRQRDALGEIAVTTKGYPNASREGEIARRAIYGAKLFNADHTTPAENLAAMERGETLEVTFDTEEC